MKNAWPCITVIVFNLTAAALICAVHSPGVSRYILGILMLNMIMYECYYVITKLFFRLRTDNWRENEGIRPICFLYLIMSFVFLGIAGYFFGKELKTTAETASQSRNLNADCSFMMFDNHDLWHFFSAAGLYQHFMFLLTLEDCNTDFMKDRKMIRAF